MDRQVGCTASEDLQPSVGILAMGDPHDEHENLFFPDHVDDHVILACMDAVQLRMTCQLRRLCLTPRPASLDCPPMSANRQTLRTGPFADIGGIIFDLDGTLADTLLDIAAGVNHALSSEGLPPADPEAIKGWVGEGYMILMRRAVPAADEAQLQRLIKTGGTFYAAHATDQTRVYPGVLEVLDRLNQASIPIAVFSNKPGPITGPTVDLLCPGIRFEAVVGYRDEATKKPNPALALEIAGKMSLSPEQVLFVGDSATDIATARNAGMKVVAVTWGFRSRQQLLPASPDTLIDTPQELLQLLGLAQ